MAEELWMWMWGLRCPFATEGSQGSRRGRRLPVRAAALLAGCWRLDVPRRLLIASRCPNRWANITCGLSFTEGGLVSHPSFCPPPTRIRQCVPGDAGASGSWEKSRPSL